MGGSTCSVREVSIGEVIWWRWLWCLWDYCASCCVVVQRILREREGRGKERKDGKKGEEEGRKEGRKRRCF